MATVFGHGLASLAAGRLPGGEKNRKALHTWGFTLAAVFLGIAPDLDIVIWVLFHPEGMLPHRGFTHSIPFGIVLAFALWLVVSRFGRKGGVVVLLALVMASLAHPMLDYLMGCGPKVPFFWPFSKIKFVCPYQFIPTAYYSKSIRGLLQLPALLKEPKNLSGILLEILIFVPILMAEKYSSPGKRLSLWALCLSLSLAAVFVVYFIYN